MFNATSVTTPWNLYSLADYPAQNVEMTLHPVKARVAVVLTPTRVSPTQKRVTDESTGVEELYTHFDVEGTTDRGDYVSFSARTVPGMEDEVVLDSELSFYSYLSR